MKQPLYKGIETIFGKLVEGSLVANYEGDPCSDVVVSWDIVDRHGLMYTVSEETIQAYSGWRDKNGDKIFTEDSVSFVNNIGEKDSAVCKFGKVHREVNGNTIEIMGFYFLKPDGRKAFPIINNYAGKHDLEIFEIVK